MYVCMMMDGVRERRRDSTDDSRKERKKPSTGNNHQNIGVCDCSPLTAPSQPPFKQSSIIVQPHAVFYTRSKKKKATSLRMAFVEPLKTKRRSIEFSSFLVLDIYLVLVSLRELGSRPTMMNIRRRCVRYIDSQRRS